VSVPFIAVQHPGWSDHKMKHVESYDHLLTGRKIFEG